LNSKTLASIGLKAFVSTSFTWWRHELAAYSWLEIYYKVARRTATTSGRRLANLVL